MPIDLSISSSMHYWEQLFQNTGLVCFEIPRYITYGVVIFKCLPMTP